MTDLRKTMHKGDHGGLYKDEAFLPELHSPYPVRRREDGIHKAPIMEFANSSYAAQCYREFGQRSKKAFYNSICILSTDLPTIFHQTKLTYEKRIGPGSVLHSKTEMPIATYGDYGFALLFVPHRRGRLFRV